jgi:tripartite-type tricarboxylate transporter receptor subunit TctC
MSGLFCIAASCAAQANDYPNKAIRLILPFASGQGADIIARTISQSISEQTSQAVVVDNRPGANGFIAAQAAATAAPDGYSVFVTSNTTHAANAALFKKLPYDPIKDFTPVTLLNKGALVFVVPADGPLKTVADLLNKARSNPGRMSYGSSSSSTRMSAEMFKQMTGAKIVYVPYKGTPQALTDLIGGQLDFVVADIPTAQALIQQGRLRALAVTSAKRHPVLKDIPTMAESGLPGYELEAWAAIFVPAGTPRPVVDKLNQLVRVALDSKAGRDFYQKAGLTASPGTPEELDAFVRSETDKWAKVIRAAGIEPE